MKIMMKIDMKKVLGAGLVVLGMTATLTACSDGYMRDLNTDGSKASSLDPNSQLTTALLQTYGDFGLMDTYRSYVTGFTQHLAGGWNVSNYAGSVHANDDQMRLIWDQYYSIAVKNLVDAIANTEESKNLNAVLRIHRVYLMSVLTDTYGDVPCMEAGKGFTEGLSNPKYDTQEEIYDFFFEELAACVAQLGTGTDVISGDVTAYGGDTKLWKRYANSLRMRFAMRISDVNPTKAQEEFEKAVQDAYIIYTDSPFTLYDGSRELDFRVNALGEILYGQDPSSPTFICTTFFNIMKEANDPRLYRICRHYINVSRSEIEADRNGNIDLTDEVLAYLERANEADHPCDPGAAWWNNWVNAPAISEIPTLEKMVKQYPEVGYDDNNFPARMMRPFLSIDFEQASRPGILMTSAEVEYLLAEAKSKGWNVEGEVEDHFEAGIWASMALLNDHYLGAGNRIGDEEIAAYVEGLIATDTLKQNARAAINTQAWILHLMNPAEAWANMRRSDYPVMMDRSKLEKFEKDFTYDDKDLSTPVRLRYPILEGKYNSVNYQAAIDRMGGSDDWHKRLWWDKSDIKVK